MPEPDEVSEVTAVVDVSGGVVVLEVSGVAEVSVGVEVGGAVVSPLVPPWEVGSLAVAGARRIHGPPARRARA